MILPKTRDGGWGYRFNPYKYGSHTMEKWIMKEKLRLCLVAVKCFPENTYFLEMLISGKGKYFHVFGCISKNFPENIFWCLEKKKENTNKKTQATTQKKKIINDENGSSPTTAPARLRSEIAIDGAIAISPSSRDRDRRRDLAKRRSWSRIFLSRRRSWFFSGLWLVFFWICVFLLLFQTPENIFRKIFWNATKHMEIFSFSGN